LINNNNCNLLSHNTVTFTVITASYASAAIAIIETTSMSVYYALELCQNDVSWNHEVFIVGQSQEQFFQIRFV